MTLPLGADLGFTGCPTIAQGPAGYVGVWSRNEGAPMMVSVAQGGAANDPPDVLELVDVLDVEQLVLLDLRDRD